MSYATLTDLIAAYGEDELIQLTDPDGEAIKPASIERALADAQAEIDGYLAVRFTLPLATNPAVLVSRCCDIALYRLMTLARQNDVEDARQRYEDAVRFLRDVAAGRATLGNVEPVAKGAGAAQMVSAGRVFGRGNW
ncbi:phage gp36-like protein [Crenobacter luteus]|uniref:gp436 family protein n=1 Tax=Crenobacter luteus TaxID=1452487 RepID=UPI0010476187|nr:phage protein Gp36 family protein [Crenobacter luteus]TCP09245.1 phage gp36-like protein [Crenobacter luteus]